VAVSHNILEFHARNSTIVAGIPASAAALAAQRHFPHRYGKAVSFYFSILDSPPRSSSSVYFYFYFYFYYSFGISPLRTLKAEAEGRSRPEKGKENRDRRNGIENR
jgi:hypothetical protein